MVFTLSYMITKGVMTSKNSRVPEGKSWSWLGWLKCACLKLTEMKQKVILIVTEKFFVVVFFIQFYVPFKIISLIETSQSIGGAKWEYPGKATWHTRKQNLSCLTSGQCGARTYTRHSGEMIKWLRALKYSDLTHSATGAVVTEKWKKKV